MARTPRTGHGGAPTSGLRCAIYLRISADRSGDELGVDRQERICRELAKQNGWEVHKVYKDDNKSAYNLRVKRVDYELMMADIKSGQVQAIVAWHADRIHRRLAQLCELIETLNKYDVKVTTAVGGHIDLSSPGGRMTAQMFGVLAEMESAIKSERLKAKMTELADNGTHRGGHRPFGYEKDGVTIRESEAEVIRQWAADVLAGKPMRLIALETAAKGIRSPETKDEPDGYEWRFSSIPRVLKAPRVAGLRQHRGEVHGQACWKPILDVDTWNAVKLVLEDPSRRHHRHAEYLLTGLLFAPEHPDHRCTLDGVCEHPADKLKGSRGHDREPVYRGIGSVVQAHRIEAELIEAALIRTDRVKIKPVSSKRNTAARKESARIKAEIALLHHARDRGDITTVDFVAGLKPLNRELAAVEREMAAEEASTRRHPTYGWMDKPGELRKLWDTPQFTFERKREALSALMERVIVLPARGQKFSAERLRVAWR